jgi:hypothetical protein
VPDAAAMSTAELARQLLPITRRSNDTTCLRHPTAGGKVHTEILRTLEKIASQEAVCELIP